MASNNGAGTLRSTSINGVKLYSITGNRYVAPWVLSKKKRALRKDAGILTRLTLICSLYFGFFFLVQMTCIFSFIVVLLSFFFGGLFRVSAEAGFDP